MSHSGTNGVASSLPILWRDDEVNKSTADGKPSQEFLSSAWSHQFNLRRDVSTRVPRAVVHATQPSHVVEAVKLAQSLGVRVSVRSGGHSWAGWGVRDDAILIDLGALPGGKHFQASYLGEGLEYDERTKIIAVPPSSSGRVVNTFLETKGRMFAGGHCSDVGLGGFLLQGGMGWNCKNWGWACESIVGMEVVTAQGEQIYCSKSENSDLFWAARGSGPGTFSFLSFLLSFLLQTKLSMQAYKCQLSGENRSANQTGFLLRLSTGFPAIVTRFYLMTRPLPQMYENTYIWRMSQYREVLQWILDVSLVPFLRRRTKGC